MKDRDNNENWTTEDECAGNYRKTVRRRRPRTQEEGYVRGTGSLPTDEVYIYSRRTGNVSPEERYDRRGGISSDEIYDRTIGAIPTEELYDRTIGALPEDAIYGRRPGGYPEEERYRRRTGVLPTDELYRRQTGALPTDELYRRQTGVLPTDELYGRRTGGHSEADLYGRMDGVAEEEARAHKHKKKSVHGKKAKHKESAQGKYKLYVIPAEEEPTKQLLEQTTPIEIRVDGKTQNLFSGLTLPIPPIEESTEPEEPRATERENRQQTPQGEPLGIQKESSMKPEFLRHSDASKAESRPMPEQGMYHQSRPAQEQGAYAPDKVMSGQDAYAQGRPISGQSAYPQGRPMSEQGAYSQGRPMSEQGAYPQGRPMSEQGAYSQGRPMPEQGAYPQGRPMSEQGAYPQGRPMSGQAGARPAQGNYRAERMGMTNPSYQSRPAYSELSGRAGMEEKRGEGQIVQPLPEPAEPMDAMEEKPKKHSVLRIIGDVLFYVVMVALVLSVFIIKNSSDGAPISVGGYSMMYVLTSSMEDVIPKGSLIVTKEMNPNELQIGDDITYLSGPSSTITHRIIEITENYADTGERAFITQGTMNTSPDSQPVAAANVVGKVIFHNYILGQILQFIQDYWKILLILLILVIALVTTLGVLFRKDPEEVAAKEQAAKEKKERRKRKKKS